MSDKLNLKERKLSPKVKIIWLGKYFLFLITILFVSWLINSTIENVFMIKSTQLYTWILIISTLFFIIYLVFIELKYNNFKYYFTQRGVVIEKGILHKEKYVVPYEKIQNVNIEYTIPLRILGIGKIIIETAGTNLEESETTLDGMDDPEGFVKEVIKEIEIHSDYENNSVYFKKSKEYIEELTEKITKLLNRIDILEEKVNEFENKFKLLNDIVLKQKAIDLRKEAKFKKERERKEKEKIKNKTTKSKKRKKKKR